MKKVFTVVAVLLVTSAFADSIAFDSTKLHNQIVTTANVLITAVPDVSPVISVLKGVLIGVGSLVTGYFIGLFRKRNAKKK